MGGETDPRRAGASEAALASERWRRIEALVHAALVRTPEDRAAFLAEACRGDDRLRSEVESLLEFEGREEKWLAKLLEEPAPEPLAPGAQVGRFRVLERIGAGGMGEVYRAWDERLDRVVALKTLPPNRLADPESRLRFLREARVASALNHPNIVTFHDLIGAGDREFLVMEHVAGKPLNRIIPKNGMRLPEALRYAIQIADALGAAHSAGVIHRDLKPSNLMVTEAGHVKLLDFGLAKRAPRAEPQSAAGDPGLDTRSAVIVGTAAYMSPEQAEGRELDARSDIFSFGVVLYEMVTGQQAFRGGSSGSTRSAVLNREPQPVRELVSGVPPDLERILGLCLKKDPNKRFHHMDDVKVELEALAEELERQTAPEADSRPRRGKTRALWFAGAGVLVVVAAVLVWTLRQRGPAPGVPPKATLLTSYAGMETIPSFSPDGSQVAFQWDGEKGDNWDIYVKSIGAENPLRLTSGRTSETSPAWSPDGRWIAFLRQLDNRTIGCYLIPPTGGAERKLAEFEGVVPRIYRGLAWFPDGKRLVAGCFGIGGTGAMAQGLRLLSLESDSPLPLTGPPRGADLGPAVSPDGKTIAFSRVYDYAQSELYLLPAPASGAPRAVPRKLPVDRHSAEDPVWTADGRDLIFSSGEFPLATLWRVPVASPSGIRSLGISGQGSHATAISWTAKRLVYVRAETDENIWRIELRAPGVAAGPPARLLASTQCDLNPEYSPNGGRIVFESCRSGNREIWVAASDGSSGLQLTSHGTRPHDPFWSPDGSWIAYTSPVHGVDQVFVVSASGGNPRRLTAHPSADRTSGWSPDGKRVRFTSDRGGSAQVWSVGVEGGEAALEKEDLAGQTSADGKYLYYVEPATDALWRKAVTGGGGVRVLGPLSNRLNYCVTPEGIYFIPAPDPQGRHFLKFHEFATGSTLTLAPLDARPSWGMSVSPDRRAILFSLYDREATDLMLVENFR